MNEAVDKMVKKNLLVAGMFIIASLALLVGCKREDNRYPLETTAKETPLLEAQGVNLVGWDEKGRESWQLQANSGEQFPHQMSLSQVKLNLLENGRPASEGVAQRVTMDNRTLNLVLKGDVKFVSYLDGAELFTSELEWIASEKKLQTEKKVLIKRGNLFIEGWGMVASPDLSQMEIKNNPTTKLIESKPR
ncbi:MAG: LPS export ABC transporter periplasmic protein LptC [bacterium]